MRRWLPVVALGVLVAVVGLSGVLALSADAPGPADRAESLAAELRCPDCQGLSVADSPTRSAQEIRRQIDELIAGGADDDAVRAHFVARYGEWIRLAPSAPAVWLIPFVAVGVGVVALVAWLVARRRSAAGAPGSQVTPEERRRLHDEAEALDA
jgi:cytochrome c-type biogenesis protein CcmH